MRKRPFSPVFSVLAAGLAAGLMLAPVDRAEAASPRETEAARLFFAGQYPDALKIYVDLAVATGDPVYMCEIGRCYHRMGKLEEASRNLRDCLTQAQLAPKKKREFQTLQAEVEAARKAAAAPPPPPPPAYGAPVGGPPPGAPPAYGAGPAPGGPQGYPPPGAPPGYPPQGQPGYPPQGQGYPPPAAPPPGQAPQGYPGYAQGPQNGPQGGPGQPPPWGAQPPGPPPENMGPSPANQLSTGVDQPPSGGGGGWMKPTAYIAAGVGVAGVGLGVFAGLTAQKKFDEVAKEYNENKHKNAKTYNTLQYVGYGLGAAGIGAGILFFLLAPSDDARAASDRLQVVASPESIGIAGRF